MTVRDEMFTLQLEQLKHDQKYHKDIGALPMQRRTSHMALHFAKYTGKIAEYMSLNDHRPLNNIIVDTFIITLVSANMFNFCLADEIPASSVDQSDTLRDLGIVLADEADFDYRDGNWLLKAIAIPTGKLAKACESLDHIDAYPYREEMIINTVEVSKISIIATVKRDIDLRQMVKSRLAEVERRSIFHGYV